MASETMVHAEEHGGRILVRSAGIVGTEPAQRGARKRGGLWRYRVVQGQIEVIVARVERERLLAARKNPPRTRSNARGRREAVLGVGAETALLDSAGLEDGVRHETESVRGDVAAFRGERGEFDRIALADERDRSVDSLAHVDALGIDGE